MCIAIRMGDTVGLVNVGGPTRAILAGSRMWHFEMTYFGPMPINKRTTNGIEGTEAFWEAVTWWAQQGERIDAAGVCIYERPVPKPIYRLSRGNYTEDAAMAARYGVTEPIAPPHAADTGTPTPRDEKK